MKVRALLAAACYLAATAFTLVGNPFATNHTIVFPIYGMLLTLPWSLASLLLPGANGILVVWAGALVNAVITYRLVARFGSGTRAG